MITREQWLQLKAELDYVAELRAELGGIQRQPGEWGEFHDRVEDKLSEIEGAEHSIVMYLSKLMTALEPESATP